MRIGFSGTHSTGKTTLLGDLLTTGYFNNYVDRSGGSRWVHSLGLPINQNGNDAGQTLIILNQVRNLWAYDDMVTDRTLIDTLVYTILQYNAGKLGKDTLNLAEDMLYTSLRKRSYSHIFYIRPTGMKLVGDGIRSEDEEYWNLTYKTFEKVVDRYALLQYDNFHIIEGTREQRVAQVLAHTHNLKDFKVESDGSRFKITKN